MTLSCDLRIVWTWYDLSLLLDPTPEQPMAFFFKLSYWNSAGCRKRTCLTLSSPVTPNDYTLKRSGPYWSNPPFLFFDIRVLWRRVPECQKIMVG